MGPADQINDMKRASLIKEASAKPPVPDSATKNKTIPFLGTLTLQRFELLTQNQARCGFEHRALETERTAKGAPNPAAAI
jgi:hypothetical protein